MKEIKKKSIARIITRRISLLLILAMLILLVCAFLIVSRIVRSKTETFSEAMLSMYTDLSLNSSDKNGVPLDAEHSYIADSYGSYLCAWYKIDYAYLYSADIENGTITYISVSSAEESSDGIGEKTSAGLVGTTKAHDFKKEELAVLSGEKLFAHFVVSNNYGHEMTTVMCITDKAGNKMIGAIDLSYKMIYSQIINAFLLVALIIFAVIAGIYIFVYMIIRRRVSEPVKRISRRMNDFISLSDGTKKKENLDISGCDEYRMICTAYNKMTDDIDSYISNIGELTKNEQRQADELEIASRIQKGFLPPDKMLYDRCEIHAFMHPAKNVGGDLYDYMRIDDSRILAVIADVSGKGISAAMLMAVTLTLIRQYAKMGFEPSEILTKTNNSLSENNSATLFVTSFVGILNTKDGTFTYANAGHNPPYIVGNKVRILESEPGTPLGLFEDEAYPQTTVPIAIGETVFMFTDGVNEATNRNDEFFGDERLIKSLVGFDKSRDDDIVSCVYNNVVDFASGADQHDDITMLALTYYSSSLDLLLDYDQKELEKIKDAVFALPYERKTLFELYIAIEECFVNICSYAFDGTAPDNTDEKIVFSLENADNCVSIRLEDGGMQFDPTENVASPDEYDVDSMIGGLGRFIAFSNVDFADYEYRDGRNVLTMKKNCK